MITTRKLKLTILGTEQDRHEQYKWIRNEQYNQYRAMNMSMTYLATDFMLRGNESSLENRKEKEILKLETSIKKLEEKIKKEFLKKKSKQEKILEFNEQIDINKKELTKCNSELKQIKLYRSDISEKFKELYISDLYNVLNKVPFQHEDMKSLVTQRVKKDLNTDIKNGLLTGDRTIRNYKRDFPLLTRGRDLKFKENDDTIEINWIEKIKFKVVLGNRMKNSLELRHTLHKIINKEYKVCDSSLQFDRNNNLILNLTLDIPENINENKIKDRIVGVDLGLKIPAYCVLNDKSYVRKSIGSIDDFLRVRTQMQSRRRKLQKALISVKGGKGREKKLTALERVKEKEKNFAKTYNHFLSKNIIKFAIDNKAEQINLELLSMKETQSKCGLNYKNEKTNIIIRNWSYYQLQQMIEYKAKREGITVKYIDPYHTSQICSECENYEEGQRINQETFICKKCGFKVNADYNAARNISKSTKYITKKEESDYYKSKENML